MNNAEYNENPNLTENYESKHESYRKKKTANKKPSNKQYISNSSNNISIELNKKPNLKTEYNQYNPYNQMTTNKVNDSFSKRQNNNLELSQRNSDRKLKLVPAEMKFTPEYNETSIKRSKESARGVSSFYEIDLKIQNQELKTLVDSLKEVKLIYYNVYLKS